jgi:hypothetical protein
VKYAALPALAILALGLTACGSGSSADSATQVPTVQPCDAIDAAKVGAVLGYAMTKNTGSADAPSCALTPAVKGGAIFQFNYDWWFQGGLDAAWKTIAASVQGEVADVTVPGADGAKLVTQETKKAAYVTGFVQNGTLIQVANGVALPRDMAKLKAATLEVMAEISAGAPSPSATPSAAAG